MPYTIVLLVCLAGTEPPCPVKEPLASALAPVRSAAFDPAPAPAGRWTPRPGVEA